MTSDRCHPRAKTREKLRGNIVNIQCMDEEQIDLLGELYREGFFRHDNGNIHIQSAYLHFTSHCNLKCPGCYSYEENRNIVPDLSLEDFKKILDNLVKAGLVYLVISGGEPFSRSDLIDFLAYARSKSQIKYIECISNGTALLEMYCEAAKYLDKLTFSLDSADSHHAKIRPREIFDDVVRKIKILKRNGYPITIVFTIHHENIRMCKELILLAKSMEVEFRFSIFTIECTDETRSPLILTTEDYQVFHDYIMNNMGSISIEDSAVDSNLGCVLSCGAGKTMVSVASNGDIYPCHMFLGKKRFALGNALNDDINDLINDKRKNIFYSIDVDNIEKCKTCHVRYICGGGCRFRAYVTCGNIKGEDPMCEIYTDNLEMRIRKAAQIL